MRLDHYIHIAFPKAATYSQTRLPRIQMHQEILDWLTERGCNWDKEWLINGKPDQQDTTWRVRFMFQNLSDALLFKLTFGGA